MIKNFTPRLYQETIFATASRKNTLVVLPTGMGKTNIFLMLAAHRLRLYPNLKVLFIGPTRPLIDQYYRVFIEHFDIDPARMVMFTGMVTPEKRKELWEKASIIFSTPQGLENDMISGRIKLEDVSLLGVDEAHRATGDYAYVFIAKRYFEKARFPRIVALTASPGSDIDKINEIVANLYIEDIEIRTEDSPDVAQYIQEVDVKYESVKFPQEFERLHKYLQECFTSKLDEIRKLGLLGPQQPSESKRDILSLQAHLQGELSQGNKDYEILRSLSLAAEAMKIQHALELIETQGLSQLLRYLEQIEVQARTSTIKAVINLANDINFRSALILARSLSEKGLEHPKIARMKEILKAYTEKVKGFKAIVFTQYRDSGTEIVHHLESQGISASLFVGQAKKSGTGLTQKKQIEMLDRFRENGFSVLVATSVGEEGLDIPQVDMVMFYEPIPSAIRAIQRRGRTGRLDKGQVIILTTKGTRDEGYKWSAHHKEKRMFRNLESLKKSIALRRISDSSDGQRKLKTFSDEQKKTLIYADYREKGSGAIKALLEQDIDLRLEKLAIGDYILSSRCAAEFKTCEDFVDSLVDGRLLQQLKDMRQAYERPLVIVEGSRDIYSIRNIHPNALRGLLATIAVSYGIPVLFAKNPQDTAALLMVIAKREQDDFGRQFSMHPEKKQKGIREQQEYIVSSLPGIGPGLSAQLLRRFGSVKGVMDASEEELRQVDKIGKSKASAVRQAVDSEYKP